MIRLRCEPSARSSRLVKPSGSSIRLGTSSAVARPERSSSTCRSTQGCRLAQNPAPPDTRLEHRGCHDVDLAVQMLLQVHQQASEVEQASTGLQLDQEIDVARGIRLAPHHRAEDPEVTGTIAAGASIALR